MDADTEEGVAFMQSGVVSGTRRQVITAKGRHFYYSGNANIRNSQGAHIDVRGMGGYVVAPGSVHESGHIYLEVWE